MGGGTLIDPIFGDYYYDLGVVYFLQNAFIFFGGGLGP